MLFFRCFCVLGAHILIAGQVESFVVLTANIADIKKIAQKLVPESIADKLADIVAQVTGIIETPRKENQDGEKLYTIHKTATRQNTYLSDEILGLASTVKSFDPISYENDGYNYANAQREKSELNQKKQKQQYSVQKNPYIAGNKPKNKKIPKTDNSDSDSIDTTKTVLKYKKGSSEQDISNKIEFNDKNARSDKKEDYPENIGENYSSVSSSEENMKPLRNPAKGEFSKSKFSDEKPKQIERNYETGLRTNLDTTLKQRNEFDQYDNLRHPNAEDLETIERATI